MASAEQYRWRWNSNTGAAVVPTQATSLIAVPYRAQSSSPVHMTWIHACADARPTEQLQAMVGGLGWLERVARLDAIARCWDGFVWPKLMRSRSEVHVDAKSVCCHRQGEYGWAKGSPPQSPPDFVRW